jgi:hypothetical protein
MYEKPLEILNMNNNRWAVITGGMFSKKYIPHSNNTLVILSFKSYAYTPILM